MEAPGPGQQALRRMGYGGRHTGHGFRSLAMGVIKARLGYRHEVVNRQLAHGSDDEYGEAIHAVVQPQPGVTVTQEQVRAYLREHVSGFKVPKSVDFSAELPREDSGKIFKRKLREPFWAGRSARI